MTFYISGNILYSEIYFGVNIATPVFFWLTLACYLFSISLLLTYLYLLFRMHSLKAAYRWDFYFI